MLNILEVIDHVIPMTPCHHLSPPLQVKIEL